MTTDTSTNALDDDRATDTVRFYHDGSDEITTLIVLTVADLEGLDPLEMAPLHGAVSLDLLEELVDDERRVTGDVMFRYYGYRVTVDSDGGVTVRRTT